MLTVHSKHFINKYLKYYCKIYAISNSVKESIFQETSIRALLIYNGINIDSIKTKQNYDFNKFKIIQISRLDHCTKGQDVLINALKHLVFELGINDIQLDFIGGGSSFGYLSNLVSSSLLENNVNFKGEIRKSTIYSLICDYNLLIQPSINEGFGLTVC